MSTTVFPAWETGSVELTALMSGGILLALSHYDKILLRLTHWMGCGRGEGGGGREEVEPWVGWIKALQQGFCRPLSHTTEIRSYNQYHNTSLKKIHHNFIPISTPSWFCSQYISNISLTIQRHLYPTRFPSPSHFLSLIQTSCLH